jgi:hypothetical protein
MPDPRPYVDGVSAAFGPTYCLSLVSCPPACNRMPPQSRLAPVPSPAKAASQVVRRRVYAHSRPW